MSIYCGADYNPEHNESCPVLCGSTEISFPFGLKEGCYANKKFQLNCTADNMIIFSSEVAQYYVAGISVEDGTITVSGNVQNNASYGKEVMIAVEENGRIDHAMPVEDDFDFSMEYDIVIRWAVTNLT